jgi:peptide/nickel transport system permease protein
MKNTIRQLLRSGKFVVGFCIFAFLILTVVIFPMFVKDPPLGIIAQGTFFPPGIYVSVYDSLSSPTYTLNLKEASKLRISGKLNEEDRQAVKEYLVAAGIPESEIDTADTAKLLEQWVNNFDPKRKISGITNAKRNYYVRLNNSLKGLLATEGAVIAVKDEATGNLQQTGTVEQSAYVNVNEVANVRLLLLGTDNFGRDVMNEIVAGTRTSLIIGLVAGLIATTIGLILGLLAGYVGGTTDDVIMFITNIFTVIPSFIILILISYSIGQEARGPMTIAVLIGITSWVWTTRAVRSQVFSLRNRDHVNLSKISGHPLPRIILRDILPYIASYVFMAFILQISSAVLAEAALSVLGLGPRTTETPTLGLMLNWALIYQAQILGKWWAYLPVVIIIALISFSLNLMNTGMDQVYNPSLRE